MNGIKCIGKGCPFNCNNKLQEGETPLWKLRHLYKTRNGNITCDYMNMPLDDLVERKDGIALTEFQKKLNQTI